jgi:hypothetical protein
VRERAKQVLLRRFRPRKIVGIHSQFLDPFGGPSQRQYQREVSHDDDRDNHEEGLEQITEKA